MQLSPVLSVLVYSPSTLAHAQQYCLSCPEEDKTDSVSLFHSILHWLLAKQRNIPVYQLFKLFLFQILPTCDFVCVLFSYTFVHTYLLRFCFPAQKPNSRLMFELSSLSDLALFCVCVCVCARERERMRERARETVWCACVCETLCVCVCMRVCDCM